MLSLTENAQAAVSKFIEGAEQPVSGLRVSVTGGGCSGFQYGMALEAEAKQDDTVVECGNVKVLMVSPLTSWMVWMAVDSSLKIRTQPTAVVVVRPFQPK
jgi:iron-sulfur cluster assembly accessory protein